MKAIAQKNTGVVKRMNAGTVKKIVRREIDKATEDKQISQVLHTNFGSIGTAWSEQNLSTIPQGDGQSQRLGNRIKIKSIEIKGTLWQGSNNTVADDYYNTVRIMLATWNNKQDTPCVTSGLTIDDPINRIYNGKGYLRHKYLDKMIPLTVASDIDGAGAKFVPSGRLVKYYKKFKKPLFVQWTDDTNDYPNQSLVLSMVSDSSAVTHPGFEIGYVAIKYEDA